VPAVRADSRPWRAAILATPLIVLLSGCGSAPGTDAVTRAANAWLAAVRSGDPAAQCRLLTPAAAESVAAHDETCPRALGDLDLPGTGRAGRVEVWSDRAQVRTGTDTLFLTRIGGRWQISGAGCTNQGDQPYDCDVAD
jgi:hypothetical protein